MPKTRLALSRIRRRTKRSKMMRRRWKEKKSNECSTPSIDIKRRKTNVKRFPVLVVQIKLPDENSAQQNIYKPLTDWEVAWELKEEEVGSSQNETTEGTPHLEELWGTQAHIEDTSSIDVNPFPVLVEEIKLLEEDSAQQNVDEPLTDLEVEWELKEEASQNEAVEGTPRLEGAWGTQADIDDTPSIDVKPCPVLVEEIKLLEEDSAQQNVDEPLMDLEVAWESKEEKEESSQNEPAEGTPHLEEVWGAQADIEEKRIPKKKFSLSRRRCRTKRSKAMRRRWKEKKLKECSTPSIDVKCRKTHVKSFPVLVEEIKLLEQDSAQQNIDEPLMDLEVAWELKEEKEEVSQNEAAEEIPHLKEVWGTQTDIEEGTAHELKIEKVNEDNILSGYRVVEISYFTNSIIQMTQAHGSLCTAAVPKIVKEQRRGLVSTLTMECSMCYRTYTLSTEDPTSKNVINTNVPWATLASCSTYE